jgi:rfaE bifunctional protein kinase chain/domain
VSTLSTAVLEQIIERSAGLTVGVLGDLFLDRYLDIDAALSEPSLETGLDAYQVVRVRPTPGAAGTVINNLVALGVKRVVPLAVIGDDGEGYELRQCLAALPGVDSRFIFSTSARRTPTYTKPMFCQTNMPARELNRLDIKNRVRLPTESEHQLVAALAENWPMFDALLVLDQVSEEDCGVVTARVRTQLQQLAQKEPEKLVLADSRERIGLFAALWAKPNERECVQAVGSTGEAKGIESCVRELARRAGRPVFCTRGAAGIYVVDPRVTPELAMFVPGFPVAGPVDIVGAGDSCCAGIACALASGAELAAAAAFGNLVASITVQQIGTTGTASPAQLRQRWQQVPHYPVQPVAGELGRE